MEQSRKDLTIKEIESSLTSKDLRVLTKEEIAVIIFEEVIEKILDCEKSDWIYLMYTKGDLKH